MRILSLDVGIASVGWWLLTVPEPAKKGDPLDRPDIGCGGCWMFEAPEDRTQSGTKLRSEARRLFRGQRRVIRRRRQRMGALRHLFQAHGLIETARRNALEGQGLDPWRLRADGVAKLLAPRELAVALGHIARHRGFQSNAKSAGRNAEEKGMLKDMSDTADKIGRFGTPALAVLEDPAFLLRETERNDGSRDAVRMLRNRDGKYFRTFRRDDLRYEVKRIFDAQRRLGSTHATHELEAEFLDKAFFQRALQDSEDMVANCPFEPTEKRAARHGISFERFRYLSRLTTLKLTGRDETKLRPDEIAAAYADFGATARISFSNLRKKIALSPHVLFEGVKPEEEGKRDVVARSGEAAAGTAKLRKLIAAKHGEMAWRDLADSHPERLDRVAEVLSFRNDLDRIRDGLGEIALDPAIRDTLHEAAAAGDFEVFTRAGHISAKAARAIIPGLLNGKTYDRACEDAHYDHTASRESHAFDVKAEGKEALAKLIKEQRISPDLVGSPTARKALIEAIKQVKAIVERHGMPDRIHVELARDVGKSIEEREEIERGIEKRNKQKGTQRRRFAELLGEDPESWRPSATELRKFELWEQQNYRCLYTRLEESLIDVRWLLDGQNQVEIDHILPWSRFGDDSFHNMTLCLTGANRNKRDQTPREWFENDAAAWDAFEARIKDLSLKGMKRRNYLLTTSEDTEDRFRNRNLNDTRWTCRLLAEALRQVLPNRDDGDVDKNGNPKTSRRVFVRPGALTDRMRRAWGLQPFKKDDKLKRVADDRHHPLDAMIIAATTEAQLNAMTTKMQREESERRRAGPSGRRLTHVMAETLPWASFREDALAALAKIVVARAPRARARGKAHDATVRQIRVREGREIVYERKRVLDMKLADVDRLKDRERNAAIEQSLRDWFARGSPKDELPRSPKGDPIAKVRLETKAKVAIRLNYGAPDGRPGAVDRGEMARVDVYEKANAKGVRQFFLVPIYPPRSLPAMRRPTVRWLPTNRKANGRSWTIPIASSGRWCQ